MVRTGGGGALKRHFVFAPAGVHEGVGLYFLSLLVFIFVSFALQAVAGLILGMVAVYVPGWSEALRSVANNFLGARWDFFFALAAVSFGAYIVALMIALAIVHRRTLLTVLTDARRFNWMRVFLGFLIYGAMLVGPFFLFLSNADIPLKPNFDAQLLAKLLAFSVIALIIQTSAEEIFFRGYLVQFMGSFTNSIVVIAGVPSLLFALSHLGNPELANDPGVFTFYFGFGLFMSFIAYVDRGIELTIGAHFANNLITAVLVRTPDSIFQTPTLYVLPDTALSQGGPLLSPLLAPVAYFILTLAVLRRR